MEDSVQLQARLRDALTLATNHLLASRNEKGHWIGELSSSALATATAVTALTLFEKNRGANETAIGHPTSTIATGIEWLAKNVNADGGWGDTIKSVSNISTTALCWAAFGAAPGAAEKHQPIIEGAEAWLKKHIGSLEPAALAEAIAHRYGKDHTFSAPILMMCALCGRLGEGKAAWKHVSQLPFELAAMPRAAFIPLKSPVTSYALPALIAIGFARHVHAPSPNLFARLVRNSLQKRSLKVLIETQPSNGGFLEATPLTSFVVMSLACSGEVNHPVARRGMEFLFSAQRNDGSWPISTNLSTWLTTLSANALAQNPEFNIQDWNTTREWLVKQQFFTSHFYAEAAPGGWSWTDLPGGAPDADDTAGALLALDHFGLTLAQIEETIGPGIEWLLNLQNEDGGLPTFCRGGALPFDRSAPDLTAHAIRAWLAWCGEVAPELQTRIEENLERALKYLVKSQRADGAWLPLWYGNQFAGDEENPIYGTSRVLLALVELKDFVVVNYNAPVSKDVSARRNMRLAGTARKLLARGIEFLISSQNEDGSWSAEKGKPASIEETALVLESFAAAYESSEYLRQHIRSSLWRGATWLVEKVESGQWKEPAPIGFYFAKLWYYEKLYPQIFTVAALNRMATLKE